MNSDIDYDYRPYQINDDKIHEGTLMKPFRSKKLAMIESDNKNTEKYPKARLNFMNSSDLDDDDDDDNNDAANNDYKNNQEQVDADSVDKDLKSA